MLMHTLPGRGPSLRSSVLKSFIALRSSMQPREMLYNFQY